MSVNLKTASESTPIVTTPLNVTIVDDSTNSSNILYPNITQNYSFRVSPGTMAVLTAYDIRDEQDIVEIYKVLRTSGTEQVGGGACCDTKKKAIPPKIAKRSIICGWALEECSPITVIKIPGIYEVRPKLPDSDISITLDTYPLQDINDEINNCT